MPAILNELASIGETSFAAHKVFHTLAEIRVFLDEAIEAARQSDQRLADWLSNLKSDLNS
jgi:hypothetical protein